MEISKLMHLTIHEQPAATATINQVDIVLAEGVAHGTIKIQEEAPKQSVPAFPPIVAPDPEAYCAQQVIEGSRKAYNALTGSFLDDKKLMDWLVAEYHKPF